MSGMSILNLTTSEAANRPSMPRAGVDLRLPLTCFYFRLILQYAEYRARQHSRSAASSDLLHGILSVVYSKLMRMFHAVVVISSRVLGLGGIGGWD